MSPKSTTRSKSNIRNSSGPGRGFRPFKPTDPSEAATEFGRLVLARMNQLRVRKAEFTRRLCDAGDREWHKGLSGPLHYVLVGTRPPTCFGAAEVWIKALDMEPWSPEANALRKAMAEQQAYTATGGKGTPGDVLGKRLHKVEAENAVLRERCQALESEVLVLRAELEKRQHDNRR